MGRAAEKVRRVHDALAHREGDRVPAGEFFWTGFLNRCKAKWGDDFDPYRHFDLDYTVANPNMDPRIMPFDVLSDVDGDIVVRTGFGATIRRSKDYPMPAFESFSVTRPEEMADFELEDPADARRFEQAGDDQLNGVGDALGRNIPAWTDRVDAYVDDLAVFGGLCEPYEYLWRCVGTENALIWMAQEPELLEAFVDRIGSFMLELARAQIAAGAGRLSGVYIWGDVAYRGGMLFSPATWRRVFRPHVKALIDLCHTHGLPVVYHGCGDARAILDDLVEDGLDAYNPLEAKAGLDVVELKPRYAGKLAFVGNIDMRVLEAGDPAAIRAEVAHKLRAARGGGYVFQSDHSISSQVAPESYELALATLRELGAFPLSV